MRLIQIYEAEGTDEDLEYLQDCVKNGDLQGVDEHFGIGWDSPTSINVIQVKKEEK